jgi:hypothetical protein
MTARGTLETRDLGVEVLPKPLKLADLLEAIQRAGPAPAGGGE